MKTETCLFAGVAAFFLVADVVYAVFSHEPAGIAALTVSFLMATLITFFLTVAHRRTGARPEDRRDARIAERAGPLGFFAPRSAFPVLAALGAAVLAVGLVFGLWLFLIGLGLLGGGVAGLVLQYAGRDD
ncbi:MULTISPECIES: aa3-type cytochrome oxidase subunit IV [Streptomycetaceae]|uniref:cytochrome-c oxidase n=1 Tax=Streptantibioticus cattleyicolor (strain ATCC 35852 / DSM 46488 / JCM 4925 / NBRC 14057 / NRRL 8057) TaxID=1003195 RepID=F8K468_STREN|nr:MULTISPECIES: cytochrome c oxidase subunit 4 [Streptomycetaceae]AEW92615.1 integral membrane protein [Streptantibioticus cattleyicolor NRRL 8057 = DSM 46488]MYS57394.1 cytochrome c oxidase subunit 4 [Streptomyces sp. SID5468]CCB72968.1 putative integral membrane protein [Streptantibioticus cattleyicolor NRRL 8057 = DSM 46488]